MRNPLRRRPTQRRVDTRLSQVSARHNFLRAESVALSEELEKRGITGDDSLTAAGTLVRHGQATYLRRLIMPWQIRAFGYYEILGEIKYASQFYSRALANLEIFAAEKNPEGDMVPTENEKVKDAVDRIRDPGGGGRSGLLASYGRLMFLVGEALLFVSINKETELEQWEMLSTDELRLMDGNYTRFMAPSIPATVFKPAPEDGFLPVEGPDGQNQGPAGMGTAAAYRLHRPNPRFSALADSTLAGALDIAEELVLLTQVVRARARSRMATAGILFIDDRITTRPNEAAPDEDPLEDPFLEDLTEALTAPITDEGTAAAVVPLVARVKVPDGVKISDLVYHLQVVDPLQIYPETGLRMECIKRLAIVLDMPPEVLLGVATVNHWGAWMVDEQSWKVHLQPIAQGLVEDLTSAYLQPYLKQQEVPGWERYYIAYDAAKVINHPDRTKDAKDLHDRAVIGDEALRDAAGFAEDDAPTEEERARIIGMKTADTSLAWYGIPGVKSGGVEPAPGEIVSSSGTSDSGDGASKGSEVEPGPPPGGPPNPGEDPLVGSVAAQIEGVAQAALLRAREAAGSKLRTACRRDDDALALIDGRSNRDVASLLGRSRVRSLVGGAKEDELVGGAREMLVETLRVFGVEDTEIAAQIAETIERHAARTLYEARPVPLPTSFPAFVHGLLYGRNGDATNG